MATKNDRYRNSSAPIGYVCKNKPELICKESIDINDISCKFMDFIIDSGILDVPDCAIYDDFIINASSDDDEIVEIPVKPCLKVIEVIDVDIEVPALPHEKKESLVAVKKEVNSEEPREPYLSETSNDCREDIKISASPKHKKTTVEKELPGYKSEKVTSEKKIKKHYHDIKQSPHSKKIQEKRDTYSECDSGSEYHSKKSRHKVREGNKNNSKKIQERRDTYSEYDSGGEYHSKKSRHKVKDGNKNDSKKIQERRDTYSEYDTGSRHKIRDENKSEGECDSGSGNESHSKKSRHKVRDANKSDGESNSRSKHRKKNYENDSNSYNKRGDHKKREGYHIDSISYNSRGDYKREDFENNSNSYRYEIKPKREPDYYSDDSDNSNRKVTGKKYSPTPGCSKDTDEHERILANMKQEAQMAQLYGTYRCNTCNISLNSYATYQSHIAGKRHQKALNAQNVAGVISKSSVATEEASKYPKPPPGYCRKQLDAPAHIQPFIDQEQQIACPSLDRVIEIHGVTETRYYCSLCNSACSPNCIMAHLNGFKHQLHSLKEFYPDRYERWRYSPKYQIEQEIKDLLMIIVKKHGRGRVKMEKDVAENEKCNPEFEGAAFRDPEMPSTSQAGSGLDFSDTYLTSSIPDPTKSGFYCRMCDSHSNSPQMWQNHIVGKRHIANLKKAPGSAPSKNKYIPAPNVRPHLEILLENVEHAVVGLSQVREVLKPEIDGVSYNCFLCSAYYPSMEIVDHVLSRKHREKYLDYIQDPEMETLRNIQMSESSLDTILEDICARVEAERGRGIIEVCYAKNAVRI